MAPSRTVGTSESDDARSLKSARTSALIKSSNRPVERWSSSISAESLTALASPSQITEAVRRSVSATCSVTRRADAGSFDQFPSPGGPVLSATHSTRPTNLESATAAAAAPVGGYGVAENWARSPTRSRSTAACHLGSRSSWARASARPATETIDAESCRRRLSWVGGGQSTTQTVMDTTPPMVQPSRRQPICDAGSATATGRMKRRSTAVDAVAAAGVMMPAKRTQNTTTAVTTTAATSMVDTTVPSAMSPLPATKRPAYEITRLRRLPVNSTSRRTANDPNAANSPTWGFDHTLWAMANTLGMTIATRTERLRMRKPGSLDRSQPRALGKGASRAGTGGAAASVIWSAHHLGARMRRQADHPRWGRSGARPLPASQEAAIVSAAMPAAPVWLTQGGK